MEKIATDYKQQSPNFSGCTNHDEQYIAPLSLINGDIFVFLDNRSTNLGICSLQKRSLHCWWPVYHTILITGEPTIHFKSSKSGAILPPCTLPEWVSITFKFSECHYSPDFCSAQ